MTEDEAIRLTEIAKKIIAADNLADFASEEDHLIYQHYVIKGYEEGFRAAKSIGS